MAEKKSHARIAVTVYLLYLLFFFLIRGYAGSHQLVIRQVPSLIGELLALIGLFYMLRLAKRAIPAEKKKARLAAAVLIAVVVCLACLALLLRVVFFTDRETAVSIDGMKKLKVESSFLLFYEVTTYDYGNVFWYRAYPCVRESYDDGCPDDLVYTDYYDKDGVLVVRVFAAED